MLKCCTIQLYEKLHLKWLVMGEWPRRTLKVTETALFDRCIWFPLAFCSSSVTNSHRIRDIITFTAYVTAYMCDLQKSFYIDMTFVTFRARHNQAKCVVATTVCVCVVSVCPAPYSYTYCTDPDIDLGNDRGAPSCALLGRFATVHEFRCYGNIRA